MFKYLFLFCFLIISSCDLPNEANKDCNGVEGGLAYLDDCGMCSGGETNIEPNSSKDLCGVCFGSNNCFEPKCNDSEAINYFEDAVNIDNTKCIYNLCEDYYENNNDYLCDLNGSPPYQIGEQLSCETVTTEFNLCYPEDCDYSVKLADFEGKNILIIYEFDWWANCFTDIPSLEEDIILEYLDHPDLAIINVLHDVEGGISCQMWGENGDDRVPIIINETTSGELGDFNNWFSGSGNWNNAFSSPWYILIDSNFIYTDLFESKSAVETKLNDLLD